MLKKLSLAGVILTLLLGCVEASNATLIAPPPPAPSEEVMLSTPAGQIALTVQESQLLEAMIGNNCRVYEGDRARDLLKHLGFNAIQAKAAFDGLFEKGLVIRDVEEDTGDKVGIVNTGACA